jgi:penicillin-binding protein-related factor A (putative recombinase)
MSYANRGRELELCVKRAAKLYRKQGRACLLQQYPRASTGRDGMVILTGSAPADFLGALGKLPGAIECKSCKVKSFPLSNIDDEQCAALDALERYGFDVRIVLEMVVFDEVYVVRWRPLREFIRAPWRKSLTIEWLRAFGRVARIDAPNRQKRVRFLDVEAHPDCERATREMLKQRSEALTRAQPSDEEEEAPQPKPPPVRVALTVDEVRARIRDAAQEGISRQLGKSKRGWAGRGRKR